MPRSEPDSAEVAAAAEPPADPAGDRAWFESLGRAHYENFPVGSLLVPRRLRHHVRRIYAFARIADDLADEHRDLERLLAFRARFAAQLDDRGEGLALFVDLAATIDELALPRAAFFDLLDAFEQDLRISRYETEAELFAYCRKSADPVGRLVLRVFGHHDPGLDARSDRICTGLQLLNHLQDLRADLVERDRIYFPRADLERFGVAEADLRAPRANAAVRRLVAHWLERTLALFAEGWPLTSEVRGRLRYELRTIVASAGRAAARIRACDHDVLGGVLRLRGIDRALALGEALSGRRPAALR